MKRKHAKQIIKACEIERMMEDPEEMTCLKNHNPQLLEAYQELMKEGDDGVSSECESGLCEPVSSEGQEKLKELLIEKEKQGRVVIADPMEHDCSNCKFRYFENPDTDKTILRCKIKPDHKLTRKKWTKYDCSDFQNRPDSSENNDCDPGHRAAREDIEQSNRRWFRRGWYTRQS